MILPVLAIALATPSITTARAVALAQDAMRTIDPTTPIVCLSFTPEHPTATRIDLVVREVHDYKCGGEDDVVTVREHFRVTRRPVTLGRFDAATQRYLPCTIAKTTVTCPDPRR